MKKQIIAVFLVLMMCLTICMPIHAESVQPMSDTSHSTVIKNRRNYAYGLERLLKQVPNTAGRDRSVVTVQTSGTFTASLDVSGVVGTFLKSVAISSGLFTVSVSSSLSVGQTFEIPENKRSILSAIGVFEQYNTCEADQYYEIRYGDGTTVSSYYQGTGTVEEPVQVFFDIYYP